MTAKMLKLSDVYSLTVKMKPVTRCEPPEGTHCHLEEGRYGLTMSEAKWHAVLNPGHYVVRDQVTRSTYVLDEP